MQNYAIPSVLFRIEPAQERVGAAISLALILGLGYITWSVTSLQLSVLAIVPLAILVWLCRSPWMYLFAVGQGAAFTYFDYAGPQAALVNIPVDAFFTIASYVAIVACVQAAHRSGSAAVSLHEQFAIVEENAAIQGWLADHDPLTSASNRRAFRRAVMHAMGIASLSGEPFGIVVGDIDNFKAVNTRYGHAVGDALLCTYFSRAQMAAEGAIVGRLDGDQFAVLFTEATSGVQLFAQASKLAREVAAPYVIGGQNIALKTTIATAMYPADAADADELFELLEKRLYAAKLG